MSSRRSSHRPRKPAQRSRGIRSRAKGDFKGSYPKGFSTPHVNLFFAENPLQGLAEDRKSQLLKRISGDADAFVGESWSLIEEAVQTHDAAELLSTASFYCLFKGLGKGTDFSDNGPYTQAYVELLQSAALRFPRRIEDHMPVLHGHLFHTLENAKDCLDASMRRRWDTLVEEGTDNSTLKIVIEQARSHTQVLRNWGYPQHMRSVYSQLLGPLDDHIEAAIGLRALDLLAFFDSISSEINSRVSSLFCDVGRAMRRRTLRGMVDEICLIFGRGEDDARRTFCFLKQQRGTAVQKRRFMLSYVHQFLPPLFSFTYEELKSLYPQPIDDIHFRRFVDSLTLAFGSLADIPVDHLLMQSPIQHKPVIRTGENYFVPIPGLFNSFFLEIVEDQLASDPRLKTRYESRRAKYLEESLVSTIRKAFPGSTVVPSVSWRDQESGKTYESDCLLLVGSKGIVFEAKSGGVAESAKRGGKERLSRDFRRLVAEPAAQAEGLAVLLESTMGKVHLTTKSGEAVVIDASNIENMLSVSVTLDWMPAPTLCWRILKEAGLVDSGSRPSITMSITDLEVLCEVLDSPAIRLHYFTKRTTWECTMAYVGDEEDLLVYYLSEGLVRPEEYALENAMPLWMYGLSDQLHNYYMAEWCGMGASAEKPRRHLTKWWRSLLERIEALRAADRWRIACALLDFPYREQQAFESQLEAIVNNVRREGNDCGENGLVCAAPDRSEAVVVGFAYRNMDFDERNDRAEDLAIKARESTGACEVVVIGIDTDIPSKSYDSLRFFRFTS